MNNKNCLNSVPGSWAYFMARGIIYLSNIGSRG